VLLGGVSGVRTVNGEEAGTLGNAAVQFAVNAGAIQEGRRCNGAA
jgi:hypothetical protein